MTASASDYLALARPRQWSKNLLVLAALVFSARFTDPAAVLRAAAAFAAFVALSAAVYSFNDALDAALDRKHPIKKRRPVAAGRIKPAAALGFGALLAALGLGAAAGLGTPVLIVAAAYLLVSAAYSLWFKHQVILDVLVLASGFVLRAAAGGLALDVPISVWLLACSTLLALFLGLAKRRGELQSLADRAPSARRSLDEYTLPLLDQMLSVVASAALVAYALYAVSAHADRGPWMMLTVPFVLYGILRYLYLMHRHGLGETPENVLLGDRATQLNLFLWAACSATILILTRP